MRFQPCQACAALARGYCCPSCREVEEDRRVKEARAWLVRMQRDPARIKALLVRIAAKRGQAVPRAAPESTEDMSAVRAAEQEIAARGARAEEAA